MVITLGTNCWGDLVNEAPDSPPVRPKRKPPELNATLIERRDFNPELAVFKIKADECNPDFMPGQYTTLGLPDPNAPAEKPKLIRRAYSIASSPNMTDSIEFYIVLVSDGQLTPLLWNMNVGDRIWMDTRAKGHFTLEHVPDGKDLVMFSTGTGLAPFLSMMETHLHEGRYNRYVIVNGVRHAPDLGYREYMEEMARKHESVYYIPMVTRDKDWAGVQGRIPRLVEENLYEDLIGAPLDPDNCHAFLCGNPQMIDQMQELLEARGFITHKPRTPGNLHFERYW